MFVTDSSPCSSCASFPEMKNSSKISSLLPTASFPPPPCWSHPAVHGNEYGYTSEHDPHNNRRDRWRRIDTTQIGGSLGHRRPNRLGVDPHDSGVGTDCSRNVLRVGRDWDALTSTVYGSHPRSTVYGQLPVSGRRSQGRRSTGHRTFVPDATTGWSASFNGNVTVNVAPPLSRFAALTSPPRTCTRFLTIARPSPVPPGRVRDLSTR